MDYRKVRAVERRAEARRGVRRGGRRGGSSAPVAAKTAAVQVLGGGSTAGGVRASTSKGSARHKAMRRIPQAPRQAQPVTAPGVTARCVNVSKPSVSIIDEGTAVRPWSGPGKSKSMQDIDILTKSGAAKRASGAPREPGRKTGLMSQSRRHDTPPESPVVERPLSADRHTGASRTMRWTARPPREVGGSEEGGVRAPLGCLGQPYQERGRGQWICMYNAPSS